MYRGPFDDREWTSYHPEGKRIFTAFVNGLNTYIGQAAEQAPRGIQARRASSRRYGRPKRCCCERRRWATAPSELQLARLVARVGVKEANRQRMPDPWDELAVPDGLDVSIDRRRTSPRGGGGRAHAAARKSSLPYRRARSTGDLAWRRCRRTPHPIPAATTGSSRGARTVTGKPIVANDPHREVTNPSLRYIVHLNAPGWNVIGAGEAPFVGVAIGHNDRLAWGLTITGTDQHDVFVEEVNPANANEVRYNGAWEALRIVREQIPVKGEAARDDRAEVQPARPDLFRGREESSRLRAALGDERTRHRLHISAGCAWRRRAIARSSSTRRSTGRRRPRI